MLLLSRCMLSVNVLPAFQAASSCIDGVSYACKPLEPTARRSALLGHVHHVFLLESDRDRAQTESEGTVLYMAFCAVIQIAPDHVCALQQ